MAEIMMRDGMLIVSETDERGTISFANEDFVSISGYTWDELMGAPHNILRHPDMPAAAFADLWKTVQSGKTWNGFVKNRTKNGDFYWVYATVGQVTRSDGSKGYLSIRQKPTRKEVEKYESLYKTMR
jgi:aerotaxis receptor